MLIPIHNTSVLGLLHLPNDHVCTTEQCEYVNVDSNWKTMSTVRITFNFCDNII